MSTKLYQKIQKLELPTKEQKEFVIERLKEENYVKLGWKFWNIFILEPKEIRNQWAALWRALPKTIQNKCEGI